MRTSQLIEALRSSLAVHGDLRVTVFEADTCEHVSVTGTHVTRAYQLSLTDTENVVVLQVGE